MRQTQITAECLKKKFYLKGAYEVFKSKDFEVQLDL